MKTCARALRRSVSTHILYRFHGSSTSNCSRGLCFGSGSNPARKQSFGRLVSSPQRSGVGWLGLRQVFSTTRVRLGFRSRRIRSSSRSRPHWTQLRPSWHERAGRLRGQALSRTDQLQPQPQPRFSPQNQPARTPTPCTLKPSGTGSARVYPSPIPAHRPATRPRGPSVPPSGSGGRSASPLRWSWRRSSRGGRPGSFQAPWGFQKRPVISHHWRRCG